MPSMYDRSFGTQASFPLSSPLSGVPSMYSRPSGFGASEISSPWTPTASLPNVITSPAVALTPPVIAPISKLDQIRADMELHAGDRRKMMTLRVEMQAEIAKSETKIETIVSSVPSMSATPSPAVLSTPSSPNTTLSVLTRTVAEIEADMEIHAADRRKMTALKAELARATS